MSHFPFASIYFFASTSHFPALPSLLPPSPNLFSSQSSYYPASEASEEHIQPRRNGVEQRGERWVLGGGNRRGTGGVEEARVERGVNRGVSEGGTENRGGAQ
jgi:hypothetical protein